MSDEPRAPTLKWAARFAAPPALIVLASKGLDWPSTCGTHNLGVGVAVLFAIICAELCLL
jgi:hypothetical protein